MSNEPVNRPGFWRRWASLVFIAGLLIPITLLRPYANGPAIRSDGVGYHIWTYALLSGQLNFTWYKGNYALAGIYIIDREPPFRMEKYPPGVALIRLPFMLPFVDRSQPEVITQGEHWMALVLAAAALLAIVALMLDCCRRLGASNGVSHLAVLSLTFGTGLFHYATYDGSFSHIYSALAVAILTWLSVRAISDGTGRLPIPATIATIALLILLRNTNGIFVIIWSAAYFAWAWRSGRPSLSVGLRNAAGIAAGLAIGGGVQIALNSHANGRLALSSYGAETFRWDRPMMGSVLLSYERGLFNYYPIVALAVALSLFVPRTRGAAIGMIVVILAYAALYGYWHSWTLGGGFGHRGFVEFMPAAMPILALSLDALKQPLRTIAFALCGICIFATVCLMGSYWCTSLPPEGTTIEVYWENTFRIDNLVRACCYSHL